MRWRLCYDEISRRIYGDHGPRGAWQTERAPSVGGKINLGATTLEHVSELVSEHVSELVSEHRERPRVSELRLVSVAPKRATATTRAAVLLHKEFNADTRRCVAVAIQ